MTITRDNETHDPATRRAAAVTVCRYAGSREEAERLLRMLGLIETPDAPARYQPPRHENPGRCRTCGTPTASRTEDGTKRYGGDGMCERCYRAALRARQREARTA